MAMEMSGQRPSANGMPSLGCFDVCMLSLCHTCCLHDDGCCCLTSLLLPSMHPAARTCLITLHRLHCQKSCPGVGVSFFEMGKWCYILKIYVLMLNTGLKWGWVFFPHSVVIFNSLQDWMDKTVADALLFTHTSNYVPVLAIKWL